MMEEKSAKKTGCHLKHQKGPGARGKIIEIVNEFGHRYTIRRHYCFFCRDWMEDEIIKKS